MYERYQLFVSTRVLEKVQDLHDVEFDEIEEAFFSSLEPYPRDGRKKHHPETRAFFGYTAHSRLLKVVFLPKDDDRTLFVISAYEPDEDDLVSFKLKGGKLYAE